MHIFVVNLLIYYDVLYKNMFIHAHTFEKQIYPTYFT